MDALRNGMAFAYELAQEVAVIQCKTGVVESERFFSKRGRAYYNLGYRVVLEFGVCEKVRFYRRCRK